MPVLYAQDPYASILTEIEANSIQLGALREHIEADKLGNRSGLSLSNPEIEFNYLWGSPSPIGNRKDLSLSQSFDFPTVYGHRIKMAKLQNHNLDWLYKAERLQILLLAKEKLINLVYYNALSDEYAQRLEQAKSLAQAYAQSFEQGETGILDYNKSQMNLNLAQNAYAEVLRERQALLRELAGLNGGKELVFEARSYPAFSLPDSFENWFGEAQTRIPQLQYLGNQIGINQQDIKLQKSLALPKFSAGYMSEKVVDEQFQGIRIGVSIPLWESKNTVKQAKAQLKASQVALEDAKMQYFISLQNTYLKALSLQESALSYKKALSDFGNAALLQKALEAGALSLPEYLLELEYYYEALNKSMEAERDFSLCISELLAVELQDRNFL